MRDPSMIEIIDVISHMAVQENALHATLSNPAWIGVTPKDLERVAWRARCLFAARAELQRLMVAAA